MSGQPGADFDGRLVAAKNDRIPRRLPVWNEEIAEKVPDIIPLVEPGPKLVPCLPEQRTEVRLNLINQLRQTSHHAAEIFMSMTEVVLEMIAGGPFQRLENLILDAPSASVLHGICDRRTFWGFQCVSAASRWQATS